MQAVFALGKRCPASGVAMVERANIRGAHVQRRGGYRIEATESVKARVIGRGYVYVRHLILYRLEVLLNS